MAETEYAYVYRGESMTSNVVLALSMGLYFVIIFIYLAVIDVKLDKLMKWHPKIVRCKDCKYCGSEIRDGIKFAKCELKHNWMPQAEWFCADGEKRR